MSRGAGSFALDQLAARLSPSAAPEAPSVRIVQGTITALDPFTVSIRGRPLAYPYRLASYQQAKVNDAVYVLVSGSTLLVLGPEWEKDTYAVAAAPPPPPPPKPPPPPPETLVTRVYNVDWWSSFRGNAPYNDRSLLYYGFDVYFKQQFHTDLRFPGATIRSHVGSSRIQSVELSLWNLYTYRGTGTQAVRVHQHSQSATITDWSQIGALRFLVDWLFPVPPASRTAWLNITKYFQLSTFAGIALAQEAWGNAYTTFGWMASPYSSPQWYPQLRVKYWT
jgi:hypothetical protein